MPCKTAKHGPRPVVQPRQSGAAAVADAVAAVVVAPAVMAGVRAGVAAEVVRTTGQVKQ